MAFKRWKPPGKHWVEVVNKVIKIYQSMVHKKI